MKNVGKRILGLLLCLLLVLSLLPLAQPVAARAEERAESGESEFRYYVNGRPGMGGSAEELRKGIDEVRQSHPEEEAPKTRTVYTDVSKAAAALRSAMVARQDYAEIVLRVPVTSNDDFDSAMISTALAHTGNPKEGDYLIFQSGVGRYYEWVTSGDTVTFTFHYYMSYYTTAAQEQELNGVVSSILGQLNVGGKGEFAKVKAVYDWLCANVVYDYVHLGDVSYERQFTAYAALKDRVAVCQGYSVAMYRLCLELGVECRVIGDDIINHAWNAVRLGGGYYYADSTWDTGNYDYGGTVYFLRGREFWSTNHIGTNSAYEDSLGYYDEAYYDAASGTWPLEPDLNFSNADYPGITSLTPHITEQPLPFSAIAGTPATMSVETDNDVWWYTWQFRTKAGEAWQDITNTAYDGTHTATLTIPATAKRDGYQYRCVMENYYGWTYTKAATLTVRGKPAITKQPVNMTAAAGAKAKYSVTATGGALSYQWQFRASSSGSWTNITNTAYSGVKTPTLTVPATAGRNGYEYRCKISNSEGTVYSNAARLTVVTKPEITKQPASVTVAAGSTAKFSVTATGGGLSYQWQVKSGDSWVAVNNPYIEGAKTATLLVPATEARNGNQYRCQVKNLAGTVYSNAAKLTVSAAAKPTITKQPASVTAATGTTAKFSVTASGSNLSYQWQFRASSSGSWANITNTAYSGMKTATLTAPATASRNGYQYRCVVKNAAGSATSNAATLTVMAKPAITAQPASVNVTVGATAKFSVTATGSGLSYQWQFRASSTDAWANITNTAYSGVKTATLSVPATASRNG